MNFIYHSTEFIEKKGIFMKYYSDLLEYLSLGVAIQVNGVSVNGENQEYMNHLLEESDSYMKDFEVDEEGEIYAVNYQYVTND
jgi:hypothetical protein